EGRLVGAQMDQEDQVLPGLILENVQALTPELAAQKSPHLGESFMLVGNPLRLWNINEDALSKVFEDLQQRLGATLEAQGHRVRRKIGLAPAAAASAAAAVDLSALAAPELAALPVDTQSDVQAEEAYQAAVPLDARELAGKFAAALVKRPPRPERPDRYPWFA